MFDKAGFLWIGTREGLLLNDGQRFRRFQHEAQNPDSISSNGIRGIFEDSRGRLWINTISGGLNQLDRSTWKFRSWRHQHNDPESLIHDGVFTLAEAQHGRLWVGTQAGLDLFDPDSGQFTRTVLATGGEFVIVSDAVAVRVGGIGGRAGAGGGVEVFKAPQFQRGRERGVSEGDFGELAAGDGYRLAGRREESGNG